ncbi:hypothetical protein TNCV_635881 [Trichonephila clavipes]|nr:hypothetical protein TNCV_635881 [Trichonephila clavipes]
MSQGDLANFCAPARGLVLWQPRSPDPVRFFPMEKSRGIGVSRRSAYTKRLGWPSTFCLYFDGHRAAATCVLTHSTTSMCPEEHQLF